ncbi:beta-ketoacyl synthase N-terminal-like domain-containing protein [Sungkyunkwania multivorans]|uniref:Beta-ketoacyl synthase N-terminal-like domain-containing protein n=1 Tax=Sungkyunkwania multivorans TaxID=1173618 RepID=A0ABW3D0A4_9FLAO
MKHPIAITSISSISSLGSTSDEVWKNYLRKDHLIKELDLGSPKVLAVPLRANEKDEIELLRGSDSKYKQLDDSVLFAIHASRRALQDANWKKGDDFGINIGSSRGATSLFEKYHEAFLKEGKTRTLTSPTTTLGNISSWVGHDLQSKGPSISHSITCSTALHALLNGVAWLRSEMTDKFLVGGSEAALTPFTIAQMESLKIYAQQKDTYPCKALDLEKKKNTMVIGEGAAVACLELGVKNDSLATIEGVGYATEPLSHNISISTNADCFQESMKMALGSNSPEEVDVIVMHAPGTIKGDLSEYNAIKKVFGDKHPALTTNKWKIGHTFGASGMLSIELAVLMMEHQTFVTVPFVEHRSYPDQIKTVLINAVGFGGNAVSVLLRK